MKKEPSKPLTPKAPEPTKADQMAAHYLAAVERRKKFWEEAIFHVKVIGAGILIAGIIIGLIFSFIAGMNWIQNQYDAKQAAIKQAQDDHDAIANLQETVSMLSSTYSTIVNNDNKILGTQSEQDARISALEYPGKCITNLVCSNAAVIFYNSNCTNMANIGCQ